MGRTVVQQVTITDDYDGKTLAEADAQTVRITMDGKRYELLLSAANVKAHVTPLTSKVEGTDVIVSAGKSAETDANGVSKRDWLKANGFPKLGDRGRFTPEQDAKWTAHKSAGESEAGKSEAGESEADSK